MSSAGLDGDGDDEGDVDDLEDEPDEDEVMSSEENWFVDDAKEAEDPSSSTGEEHRIDIRVVISAIFDGCSSFV